MGVLYEEFERRLDGWRRKYAGDPRREMMHLFLLALEREELVSVGYRETVILRRLRTMSIPQEAKDLIHHAMVWAWKDEEMHAMFIRGAIFRMGNLPLRLRALLRQWAGAVAGWSSSVRQHARWREAPLARALATLVTWTGRVLGKVPRDVREHLEYRPFREFCLFNVDAERTAWLCWGRIVELASDRQDLPDRLLDDFRRIVDDEERHRQVFEVLAGAFDAQDRLQAGQTAEGLARQIAAVGEPFLPRALRTRLSSHNPLGGGGRVWVLQGTGPEEKLPLFRRLLEEAGLKEALVERARACGKDVSRLRVVIKPTFMLGYHRRDPSVVTDPALVEELAVSLRGHGCRDISIIEGRNIYDRFYRNRGVEEVARYFGFSSPHYRVRDASEEQVPHRYERGMAQYTVARTWREADLRISFPKLRSHPIELAYLAVANVEWIGARCEEFVFIERQARRETAIMMLLDEFPPHFALLDAYDHAADGLLGVMGCPRPLAPRRFYAGADALALDRVVARHLGVEDPRDSSLLRAALHWFGGSTAPVEIMGLDAPIPGWRSPYANDLSTILSFLAFPVYVLGSGRGALFVPEMDEEAFPPLGPEGRLLRLARRSLRLLLGLRLPRDEGAAAPRGAGSPGGPSA